MAIESKAILSAIFIFLGAMVFFTASVISGHSIFRESSKEVAMFLSALVGSVLFAFSPISFIILAPGLFCLDSDVAPTWLCVAPASFKTWQQMLGQIQQFLLLPFLLSAIGSGAVIGALEAMGARTLTLNWLRRKTGLGYPILSYETSWDKFLLSLKRGASIRVHRKGVGSPATGKAEGGKLRYFSIRDEPKELVIECEDGYRLIGAKEIDSIDASREAFNRHMDRLPHHVEAAYLTITMLGLLCLAESAELIREYFVHGSPQAFHNLIRLYQSLSHALLASGFLLAAIAYKASRQDFRHFSSYVVLCPTIPFALLFGASALAYLAMPDLMKSKPIGSMFAAIGPWAPIFGPVTVAYLYRTYKIGRIDDLLERVAGRRGERRKLLLEVCQHIYLGTDLNHASARSWQDMLGEHQVEEQRMALEDVCRDLCKTMDELIRRETFLLLRSGHYLEGEEWNIVLRLLRCLDNERYKALPVVANQETCK